MSLADYQKLVPKLSMDGEFGVPLKAQAATEVRLAELSITSPPGTNVEAPSFLTPAMSAWYRTYIASHRRTAINEVRYAFQQDEYAGNRGFLFEVEQDEIEGRRYEELKAEREVFFQQEIREDIAEIDRLEKVYSRKRAEYGRDARKLAPYVYGIGLTLIMLLEFPLNLSAFLKIGFLTPALATASVFLVAIVFGFSSHMLGIVFRQWSERFGGNVGGRLKADSWRWLIFGVILFLIGAAAVFFSRSYLIADEILRRKEMGEDASSIGLFSTYGIAFIGNFAVFAAGLVWVMFFHDPVPNYAEERFELERLRKRYSRRARKQLEGRQQQKREQARRAIEQLRRRDAEQAQRLQNHGRYRAMMDEVRKVDDQVIAMFENYRAMLTTQMQESGLRIRFVYDDLGTSSASSRRELNAHEYLRLPLRLGFAS